jgi:hypothetical protein
MARKCEGSSWTHAPGQPDPNQSGPAASAVEALGGSGDAANPGVTAGVSPDERPAVVLDQLDQARTRMQTGDLSPESAREQAEDVEHLEGWAYVTAEFAADQSTSDELGQGTPAQPADTTRRQASLSPDPVLVAHVAELLADLDATAPDPYPGDDSQYWDTYTARVTAQLPQQPADVDAASDAALAADDETPEEPARGDDPVSAATTAPWMAAEAAATQRWLAAEQAGLTPVDPHDRMVARHDRDQHYAVTRGRARGIPQVRPTSGTPQRSATSGSRRENRQRLTPSPRHIRRSPTHGRGAHSGWNTTKPATGSLPGTAPTPPPRYPTRPSTSDPLRSERDDQTPRQQQLALPHSPALPDVTSRRKKTPRR